jgi:hypothetical protein
MIQARGQRPGDREAVPGVADRREPVAVGSWPRAAEGRWPPRGRAGAKCKLTPAQLEAALDAGPDRGPGLAAFRGGVHVVTVTTV